MVSSSEPKKGDFFEIKLPNDKTGYGQIVIAGKVLYVIIFDGIYDVRPPLESLQEEEILLAGWTLDGLLYAGRWIVIGNRAPQLHKIPFPRYKVLVSGSEYIHDFDDENYRLAEASERAIVDYKTTVAPIRYQKAFMACHGFGNWQEEYDYLMAARSWKQMPGHGKSEQSNS